MSRNQIRQQHKSRHSFFLPHVGRTCHRRERSNRPMLLRTSLKTIWIMGLATVLSRAQIGIDAPQVMVEVHLGPGLPGFGIVGLPETAVRESKDRVRAALDNAGFRKPQWKTTVSLAPADLPKEGARFDLPIALGVLAASGQVESGVLSGWEFIGELALDGSLRPIRGCLPAILQARQCKRSLVVPAANSEEA